MRKLSAAMCVLGGIGVALVGQTARAADGCSYNAYGQLYCLQGAQPGCLMGTTAAPITAAITIIETGIMSPIRVRPWRWASWEQRRAPYPIRLMIIAAGGITTDRALSR